MSEIINSSEALTTMLLGFAIVSIIINLVLFDSNSMHSN